MTRRVAEGGLRTANHRRVDRARDRGAAAEQRARRILDDRIGECFDRRLIGDQRPWHDGDLQERAGPLHHADGDRLRRASTGSRQPRADGGTRPRSPASAARSGAVDATRGVDHERQREVDFRRCARHARASERESRASPRRMCAARALAGLAAQRLDELVMREVPRSGAGRLERIWQGGNWHSNQTRRAGRSGRRMG